MGKKNKEELVHTKFNLIQMQLIFVTLKKKKKKHTTVDDDAKKQEHQTISLQNFCLRMLIFYALVSEISGQKNFINLVVKRIWTRVN